jgi:hypothetical protein
MIIINLVTENLTNSSVGLSDLTVDYITASVEAEPMTDIAPLVSSLLTSHSSSPIQEHVLAPDRLDTFLQEAYRIVRALVSYRSSDLSTSFSTY